MASPFETLISNLDQLGVFGFLLPWIFAFAVFYGLLLKSKAVGEDHKIIGIISLVAAFFVVGFGGVALGTFFKTLFGTASMILAAIIVTLMFIGMAGYDISKLAESKAVLAAGLGIGAIVFFSVLGNTGTISSDILTIIFVVILMIVSVLFIAKN